MLQATVRFLKSSVLASALGDHIKKRDCSRNSATVVRFISVLAEMVKISWRTCSQILRYMFSHIFLSYYPFFFPLTVWSKFWIYVDILAFDVYYGFWSGLNAVYCWACVSGGNSTTREDGPVEQNCVCLPGENLDISLRIFLSFWTFFLVQVTLSQSLRVLPALSSDPPEGWRQHPSIIWCLCWSSRGSCVCQVHQRSIQQASIFGFFVSVILSSRLSVSCVHWLTDWFFFL